MKNKFQTIIHDFDKLIDQYVFQVEGEVKRMKSDFGDSIEFKLNDDFDSTIFNNKEKKQGLYFFEIDLDSAYLNRVKIKTKVKSFIEDWSKKKHDSFFSSSVIKKRAKHYENFDEKWLPLYIGKNKDVYRRILEHIELSPTSNTYAMKLKSRTNLNDVVFRVSVLNVDVTNYDFIVPYIEKILRNKYLPIVGKQ